MVELDGIQTMHFQKCEGLEAESEVFELEEGGVKFTALMDEQDFLT